MLIRKVQNKKQASIDRTQQNVEMCPGDQSDHIGFSNMVRRGMIPTVWIAKRTRHETVLHRHRDIVQQ